MKFFIGLILGIIMAGGLSIYLNKAGSPFIDKVTITTNPPLINSSSPLTLAPSSSNLHEISTESSDAHYDFYDVLPGKNNLSEQNSESTEPNKLQYYIQAGAFNNQDAANNLKAKLALLGIDSSVKATNENNSIINRIMIGPFADSAQAQTIIEQLQQQQIDAVLTKTN